MRPTKVSCVGRSVTNNVTRRSNHRYWNSLTSTSRLFCVCYICPHISNPPSDYKVHTIVQSLCVLFRHIFPFVCLCYSLEVRYRSFTIYSIQDIHKRMVRFQMLTRNLFLALHGHNEHSSSNCPSFSYATSSSLLMLTAGPVSKMASQQEKAFCVLRFEVSRSVITVQRDFRARFRKDAPGR